MHSRMLATLATAFAVVAAPAVAQPNPAAGLSLAQAAPSSARASASLDRENRLVGANPLGWVLLAAAGAAFIYVAIQLIDNDDNDNPVSP